VVNLTDLITSEEYEEFHRYCGICHESHALCECEVPYKRREVLSINERAYNRGYWTGVIAASILCSFWWIMLYIWFN